jgi:hypothetical protein
MAGAIPVAALGQAAQQPDPAATVDRFLQVLQRGQHRRLGPLLADRVANGEGRSLSRSQMVLVYEGYTYLMFGPMRSRECAPPETNKVTCTLHFQSRRLTERYTVEPSGLISGIEALPDPATTGRE